MLERVVSSSGVVLYRSRLLQEAGVRHGFSTRIGGVSPRPFDSMNLGNPNGCDIQDDYQHIWTNYARLLAAIDAPGVTLCRVHQVHGDRVVRAERGRGFDVEQKADGILTDDPAQAASVRVADCVPVLLATADGATVAAVHAGWRGVVAGVTLRALEMLGTRDVIAAIGPCIGFDAFEVGGEVLDEFERVVGPGAPLRRRSDGKGHIDLRQTLRRQLMNAGVAESCIDTTDRCTATHSDEFFSHRRDNGLTGRMAAVITPRVRDRSITSAG